MLPGDPVTGSLELKSFLTCAQYDQLPRSERERVLRARSDFLAVTWPPDNTKQPPEGARGALLAMK